MLIHRRNWFELFLKSRLCLVRMTVVEAVCLAILKIERVLWRTLHWPPSDDVSQNIYYATQSWSGHSKNYILHLLSENDLRWGKTLLWTNIQMKVGNRSAASLSLTFVFTCSQSVCPSIRPSVCTRPQWSELYSSAVLSALKFLLSELGGKLGPVFTPYDEGGLREDWYQHCHY